MSSKLTESIDSKTVTEPTSERSWLKKIRRTCNWAWWLAAAIAFGWTMLTIGLS